MEYFGIFAFIMVLSYSGLPGRVKRLETKIKNLSKKQKGENYMSKIIHELVGKECFINTDKAYELSGGKYIKCKVLDADDEWIKINYTDKKKNDVTRILRIEDINDVEIADTENSEETV